MSFPFFHILGRRKPCIPFEHLAEILWIAAEPYLCGNVFNVLVLVNGHKPFGLLHPPLVEIIRKAEAFLPDKQLA